MPRHELNGGFQTEERRISDISCDSGTQTYINTASNDLMAPLDGTQSYLIYVGSGRHNG